MNAANSSVDAFLRKSLPEFIAGILYRILQRTTILALFEKHFNQKSLFGHGIALVESECFARLDSDAWAHHLATSGGVRALPVTTAAGTI